MTHSTRRRPRLLLTLCFAFCLQMPAALAAAPGQTDLLPSFDNPKLRFGTGKVAFNQEVLSQDAPAIPGTSSGWNVTQWSQSTLMTPDQMTTNDPATKDPDFGLAAYGFTAPDQHSHVWIYLNGPQGHPVYELFERGGTLAPKGGSNIFLSAKLPTPANFSQPVTFSMQAKVSHASISYDTPTAQQTGAVLGMAFIGFGINFPSPINNAKSTLFLQISLANSRGQAALKSGCHIGNAGGIVMIMGGDLQGVPPLPFATSSGALTTVSFSMNDYISSFLNKPLTCSSNTGPQQVTFQNIDPGSIILKSVFIGLETQNIDKRKRSVISGPQGQVELGLQISNVHLTD